MPSPTSRMCDEHKRYQEIVYAQRNFFTKRRRFEPYPYPPEIIDFVQDLRARNRRAEDGCMDDTPAAKQHPFTKKKGFDPYPYPPELRDSIRNLRAWNRRVEDGDSADNLPAKQLHLDPCDSNGSDDSEDDDGNATPSTVLPDFAIQSSDSKGNQTSQSTATAVPSLPQQLGYPSSWYRKRMHDFARAGAPRSMKMTDDIRLLLRRPRMSPNNAARGYTSVNDKPCQEQLGTSDATEKPDQPSPLKAGTETDVTEVHPMYGIRDSKEEGPVEVCNGIDWEAAHEAKKRKSGSQAAKLTLADQPHLGGAKEAGVKGPTVAQSKLSVDVLQSVADVPPPHPNTAVPPTFSTFNLDKLSNSESETDLWQAMQAFLTIQREDFPTGSAFLHEYKTLRRRCRREWGAIMSTSFGVPHLIQATRSHRPQLADALRRAFCAGEIDFHGVVTVVICDDPVKDTTKIGSRRTFGDWLRVCDDDGDDGRRKKQQQQQEQQQEQPPEAAPSPRSLMRR